MGSRLDLASRSNLPTHDVQHTGITLIMFPLTADGKMEA